MKRIHLRSGFEDSGSLLAVAVADRVSTIRKANEPFGAGEFSQASVFYKVWTNTRSSQVPDANLSNSSCAAFLGPSQACIVSANAAALRFASSSFSNVAIAT